MLTDHRCDFLLESVRIRSQQIVGQTIHPTFVAEVKQLHKRRIAGEAIKLPEKREVRTERQIVPLGVQGIARKRGSEIGRVCAAKSTGVATVIKATISVTGSTIIPRPSVSI